MSVRKGFRSQKGIFGWESLIPGITTTLAAAADGNVVSGRGIVEPLPHHKHSCSELAQRRGLSEFSRENHANGISARVVFHFGLGYCGGQLDFPCCRGSRRTFCRNQGSSVAHGPCQQKPFRPDGQCHPNKGHCCGE